MQEAELCKKEAYKELKRIKKDCPDWRNEFNKDSREERAKEKGVPVLKTIAQDKREQKQKDQGQKRRQMAGKGLKEPILTTLVKSPDGTLFIICNL